MTPTEPHYLTLIGPEDQYRRIWQSLPPLDGANKFLEVKDRGRVLATSPDGAPLLVSGEFGRGRVVAFAGDSTWRWRLRGHEAEHKRFWRQLVLWLARRDDLIQDNVWVRLPQRRFHPGAEGATFTAGARSAAGDPIADATLKATVQLPDGATRDVSLTASGGEFTGSMRELTQPGVYQMKIQATKGGKTLGVALAQFEVFDHDVELSNPAARHDQFAQLAAVTRDAGGRFLPGDQIGAVFNEVKKRPLGLEVDTPRRRYLGKMWTDAWLVFLILTGLLTAEWMLRKRWSLA